ncbi:trehalose-phosphatase [Streptomyces pathocidini]|uniref:trehalose-phosphatase n=1 Tax=Streptomyces pathocidini TaxID=1650571 RepID=UPI0033D26547
MGTPGSASLPTPSTPSGREGLAALLERPQQAALVFDFDGTLSPIVPDPDQARAHPGAVPALARLAPLVGSIAVLTGRPAGVAARNGGFANVPGLERMVVLGQYGVERWDAASGEIQAPPVPAGVAAVQAELPALLDREGAGPGTFVEDKGRAIAVHTRRADDPRGTFERLRAPLYALAERHGLIVEPGRLVLELRPPGMDKGVALEQYVRESGAGAVLYAGDDLGDLAAYAAVGELRAGGLPGVLVCSAAFSGEGAEELAEQADLVVDGPQGVVALIDSLTNALTR